jgi:hypothetical protein
MKMISYVLYSILKVATILTQKIICLLMHTPLTKTLTNGMLVR